MKPFETRPVKMPVFMITSAPTRSGFSTAQRSPIGPPQSWTTTTASLEVEAPEQRGRVFDVAVVAVPAAVGGLVGAPEAGVVGADHPVPRRDQRRQHLAVEVGPGRLAVEADDRAPLALVDVVQAQPVHLGVVGLEVVARQALEALVGGAEDVHRAACSLCLGSHRLPTLPRSWRPPSSRAAVQFPCPTYRRRRGPRPRRRGDVRSRARALRDRPQAHGQRARGAARKRARCRT